MTLRFVSIKLTGVVQYPSTAPDDYRGFRFSRSASTYFGSVDVRGPQRPTNLVTTVCSQPIFPSRDARLVLLPSRPSRSARAVREARPNGQEGCEPRNHPSISFSSLPESFDVVIQNILTRRTLDLDEGNLTSCRVLSFNVNAFPLTA